MRLQNVWALVEYDFFSLENIKMKHKTQFGRLIIFAHRMFGKQPLTRKIIRVFIWFKNHTVLIGLYIYHLNPYIIVYQHSQVKFVAINLFVLIVITSDAKVESKKKHVRGNKLSGVHKVSKRRVCAKIAKKLLFSY